MVETMMQQWAIKCRNCVKCDQVNGSKAVAKKEFIKAGWVCRRGSWICSECDSIQECERIKITIKDSGNSDKKRTIYAKLDIDRYNELTVLSAETKRSIASLVTYAVEHMVKNINVIDLNGGRDGRNETE